MELGEEPSRTVAYGVAAALPSDCASCTYRTSFSLHSYLRNTNRQCTEDINNSAQQQQQHARGQGKGSTCNACTMAGQKHCNVMTAPSAINMSAGSAWAAQVDTKMPTLYLTTSLPHQNHTTSQGQSIAFHRI
jgi:hypothetical protein